MSLDEYMPNANAGRMPRGCTVSACLSVYLQHRCRRLGELQPGPPGAAAAVKAVDITVLGFALRWGGGLICADSLNVSVLCGVLSSCSTGSRAGARQMRCCE